jgi:formylglycine-generating enzyme required for sulfatase activity
MKKISFSVVVAALLFGCETTEPRVVYVQTPATQSPVQTPPAPTKQAAPQTPPVRQEKAVPAGLVRVEPGTFQMGGTGEYDGQSIHSVTISRAFNINQYKVTRHG